MKKNFRITFYDGPEGNRSKNVDIYARDFDDARSQAYKMDEAKYRMYSDMIIEKIPEGPSIIGVEYQYYYAYFDRYYTDRVFIKANNEAEALKYFNEHFSNRGTATKTYFSCGTRYEADATIEPNKEPKDIDKLIADATAVSNQQTGNEKRSDSTMEKE